VQLQLASHVCAIEVADVALETDLPFSDEAGVIVGSAARAIGEGHAPATVAAATNTAKKESWVETRRATLLGRVIRSESKC
jgi:hypothetical protein